MNMTQSDVLIIDDIDRRLLGELQQDSSRPVGVIVMARVPSTARYPLPSLFATPTSWLKNAVCFTSP